jgi:hypothetical protein
VKHIAVTYGHGARIAATPAHRLDLLRPEIDMVVEVAGEVDDMMAAVGQHARVLQHDVVAAELGHERDVRPRGRPRFRGPRSLHKCR